MTNLALFAILSAFAWGGWKLSKFVARSMAWIRVVAIAGLSFCALSPLGLGLSAWIIARDDGSEAGWRISVPVLNFAEILPLLAILLGFIGLFAAIQLPNFSPLKSKLRFCALYFGILCLASYEILFLMAGFGPHYIATDEAQTVHSLHILYDANLAYTTAHPNQFAPSIAELRAQSQREDGGISRAVSDGKAHGYRFTYALISTKNDNKFDGFRVVAEPLVLYHSGVRYFLIDQTGVVRFDNKYPTDKSPQL